MARRGDVLLLTGFYLPILHSLFWVGSPGSMGRQSHGPLFLTPLDACGLQRRRFFFFFFLNHLHCCLFPSGLECVLAGGMGVGLGVPAVKCPRVLH